ncbi:Gfo/Idh/MocA family oxidoreductase [Paenibacillus sp. J5C_2022]|uniref:Gfo/Idh/MocA family protein n=1 Tax=Paenibacillus sp. J5C2022 TaxID=2977129 RepID=UPI0021D398D6|nr:Gfo/Idh/MocA family oxidoreductase [Paenibacillus sp. J5C2022]MCU6711563.1 Gfo/Idh/MocA family oxidoreductase [Paenibacillus sp. J5C2022]
MKPVTIALIGAGLRGIRYGEYANKRLQEMKIVSVAEPDDFKRIRAKEAFGIPEEKCFKSWDELFSAGKQSDAVFICTRDQDHYVPAMKALEAGYHVMLEKPMSPSWKECIELERMAEKHNRILTICHVLRYAPFFQTIKQLLDEGRIGRLMSIQHNENVGYWHQAHSYVRGYFNSAEKSSPMILAKSCHDMDIIQWFAGGTCVSVSSYGHLSYFNKENAPDGAPEYCIDGCPIADSCVYYAPDTYMTDNGGWKAEAASTDPSFEARYKAMKEGPFGRCVFRSDNDVVDHQVVAMDFDNEVTVAFTMSAFTEKTSRTLKLMGTTGEIRATMETNEIEVRPFGAGRTEVIKLEETSGHVGHGGGDGRLVQDFARTVRALEAGQGTSVGQTSAKESVQSHLMAFAAERSRVEKRMVQLEEFY